MSDINARTPRGRIVYWLQGQSIQNFGDFLSEYFAAHLFVMVPRPPGEVRLVGSCLEDTFIPTAQDLLPSQRDGVTVTAWTAGMRAPGSLSAHAARRTEILAVRGPLTASELALGIGAPIGDAGLLLPALYSPRRSTDTAGRVVCVPHFHDRRSDEEICRLTGAEVVLRTAIGPTFADIEAFVDRLTSAGFVLCGALHAAIVAAAYGRPFGFWDSGNIDLPFKWRDFAASIGIAASFHVTASEAQAWYEADARNAIRLPSMWRVLAVSPYPVKPAALLRLLRWQQQRVAAPASELDTAIEDFERHAAHLDAIAIRANQLVDDIAERANAACHQRECAAAQAREQSDRARSLENTVEALQAAMSEVEQQAQQLSARLQIAEEGLRGRSQEAQAAMDTSRRLSEQITQLSQSGRDIASEFAFMSQRPWRLVERWMKFTTLNAASRWRRLLPGRTRDRFARSAAKRDPMRPVRRWELATANASAFHPGPSSLNAASPAMVMASADLKAAFQMLHGRAAIHFPPVEQPEVSVIIPAYRGLDDVLNCLRSLAVHGHNEPSFEVIVVDDCPSESVLWALPPSGGLRTLGNDVNLGFLLTCRRGADIARGKVLCFLNSDTLVTAGWLSTMVAALASSPKVGMVGSMLLNRDGTIQDVGWRMLSNGWGDPIGRGAAAFDGRFTYRRTVDCVTGACFVVSREVWDRVDGFDPLYAPAFYEEFDLAFRLRRLGLETVCEPRSQVIHLGSASYGAAERDRLSGRNHAKFCERFADELRKQPSSPADDLHYPNAGPRRPVILVADLSLPQPDRHAGDVTLFSYLGLLAEGRWRVVFAPQSGQTCGPHAAALESRGIEIVREPFVLGDWLKRYGAAVDHVLLCRPELASTLLEPVRSFTSATVWYYTHDLHHLRMQRDADLSLDERKSAAAREMKSLELGVLQAVDRVLTPSSDEAVAIQQLLPQQTVNVVPPYFFDAWEIAFRPASSFESTHDLLFVGGFPHTPNVDAALFLATEVMPRIWKERPAARLLLVGYAPPPEVVALAGERIVVTGQVADLAPWVARSRLLLAPLRYGAGVKGKVVEALRMGLPVVTTPIGAEGIGISPGVDALVHDSADALAQAALSLMRDPARCAELSRAGASLVSRRFSRAAARQLFHDLFAAERCSVCGSTRRLGTNGEVSSRESFVCQDCFALARTEALARVMCDRLLGGAASLLQVATSRTDLRVHEFGFVGAIAEVLRGLPGYSMSDFFPDVEPGTSAPNGIRCEDLGHLTFADESLDVAISQDVMEHVPDVGLAFGEVARVLKPGGIHFFTVPQDRTLPNSVVRAAISADGTVTHILPPAYHGDPVRTEGALVYTDFGMDLERVVRSTGLHFEEIAVPINGGAPQATVFVYVATKPRQN